MTEIGTVGKKGELYPPKDVREQAGLLPGAKVQYYVEDHTLKIQRIPTIAEALKMPKFAKITQAEIKKARKELYEEVIANVDKELGALKKG